MKVKNDFLEISRCPHCNIYQPNMELKWQSSASFSEDYNTMTIWKVFECTLCFAPTAVKLASINGNYEIVDFFPKAEAIHSSIPEKARYYLLKAIDSVHNAEASILLCSSSIDSMFKELGYKDGSLYSKINKAAGENKITESMKIWSDKIRLDANAIRHADENFNPLTIDDAKRALEFTLALAEFLFVIPYKIKQTSMGK